jgi:hypothetical protein
MKLTYYTLVNGTLKFYYIKRLITLTSNYIKWLSLYKRKLYFLSSERGVQAISQQQQHQQQQQQQFM